MSVGRILITGLAVGGEIQSVPETNVLLKTKVTDLIR
jgi:hypothetical protein